MPLSLPCKQGKSTQCVCEGTLHTRLTHFRQAIYNLSIYAADKFHKAEP